MLGQTLQRFTSELSRQDVARPNRFVAMISPPGGSNNSVNLMCESAEFPGQNIRTTPDTLRYGPQREIGHAAMYAQSMNLTFICLSGMPERTFFENWQGKVFNKSSWEANYYSDYIGTIALHQLDRKDNQRFSIYVQEAYPKTIAAQTFNQGSNNAYQTLSVNFTFRSYDSSNSPGAGSLGGLLGALSSVGGVIGAAANLVQDVNSARGAVQNIRSTVSHLI